MKHVLRTWISVARKIYNLTINFLLHEKQLRSKINEGNRNQHKNLSKFNLRDYIKGIAKDVIDTIGIPNTTVEYAIFQAHTHFWETPNSNFKYRSCKDLTSTIFFDGRKLKSGNLYPSVTKKTVRFLFPQEGKNKKEISEKYKKLWSEENITISNLERIHNDKIVSVTFRRTTKTFIFNYNIPNTKKPIEDRKPVICNDGGVRTFQTYYDGENWGKIGDRINHRLYSLLKKADNMKSKASKYSYQTRRRYYKAIGRINEKVRNIVSDLHWKCAHFQTTNYETIIQPQLDYISIVKSLKTKIKSKTQARVVVRLFYSLSHYSYLLKLKYKCAERQCNLIICDEPYTTKTCPHCLDSNDVKGATIYKCQSCGYIGDRDYVGVHNNLNRVIFSLPGGAMQM